MRDRAGPYRTVPPCAECLERDLILREYIALDGELERLRANRGRGERRAGAVLTSLTLLSMGIALGWLMDDCTSAHAQPVSEGGSDPSVSTRSDGPGERRAVADTAGEVGVALGRGLEGGRERGWVLADGPPGTSFAELAPALDPVEQLGLAVAKVAANEASLDARREDVALIWQVTQGRARTHQGRLAWLERHSSCVLTDRQLRARERRTNCLWTRGLKADDAQPEGWPERWGSWERYVERWRRIRAYALRLVRGERHLRPCAETPTTWGSRLLDMEQALRRGLRPVSCSTRGNVGFVPLARRRR